MREIRLNTIINGCHIKRFVFSDNLKLDFILLAYIKNIGNGLVQSFFKILTQIQKKCYRDTIMDKIVWQKVEKTSPLINVDVYHCCSESAYGHSVFVTTLIKGGTMIVTMPTEL